MVNDDQYRACKRPAISRKMTAQMVATLIETWEALPKASEASAHVQENLWFDLKETYAPDSRAEMAKDVAAFANAEGGAIIIGALEGTTGPDYSRPLSVKHAAMLEDAFDKAVRDLCRPSPAVHARTIPVPGTPASVILVVNIEPLVDQPVAARHETAQDAWRFPLRVGRHTECLLPEQLPLYMNSKARRAKLLLLRALRSGGKIDLFAVPAGNATHETIRGADEFNLDAVDPEESGSIVLSQPDEDRQVVTIPIDDVEAVWLQHSGRWAVRIAGRLDFLNSIEAPDVHKLFYLPPSTFVVSPLGLVLKDIPKNVKEVATALHNTLVVRHHPRKEPNEADLSQLAHERWRFREARGIAGSAEDDWQYARARILAATRDA